MATHSVPQDVEADDKLIGFLSLKQFIFTVIGLGFGYLTFFFFTRVHPIAALPWLPFALVFLVLGLYQRKDQPAEVFLVSALGFYLKPKVRIWNQEGYDERIHITAPPVIEKRYTKDFTGEEARGRLANLSLMMDSRGWASKRVDDWQNPQMATVAAGSDRIMSDQDFAKVQVKDPMQMTQPPDQYDDRSIVGQQFENKIAAADEVAHKQALDVMHNAEHEPSTVANQPISETRELSIAPPTQATPTPEPISKAPFAQDTVVGTDSFSTNTLPSINDGSDLTDDTTTKQPDNSSTTSGQPLQDVVSARSIPASEPATTKVADDDDIQDSGLNVPHQNDDGSVELRLH